VQLLVRIERVGRPVRITSPANKPSSESGRTLEPGTGRLSAASLLHLALSGQPPGARSPSVTSSRASTLGRVRLTEASSEPGGERGDFSRKSVSASTRDAGLSRHRRPVVANDGRRLSRHVDPCGTPAAEDLWAEPLPLGGANCLPLQRVASEMARAGATRLHADHRAFESLQLLGSQDPHLADPRSVGATDFSRPARCHCRVRTRMPGSWISAI
jgi:hypothetical protein